MGLASLQMNKPPSTITLDCGGKSLSLDVPRIMGILNVTPDSFSDGGRFVGLDAAMQHAESLINAGADILDIGGESTRPGAASVSEQQELDRVMPVLEAVRSRFDCIVSIDTSKAMVMQAVGRAGAGMLNDVRALQEPDALKMARDTGLPVCLMHMQGEPRSMQSNPSYQNIVVDVAEFLLGRVEQCVAAGIARDQVLIDPGFGFGKTLEHNIALIEGLPSLTNVAPVLVGLSRKRMIGQLLGDDNIDRTMGSVVAALRCIEQGASIVRVHDVAQMAQAIRIHAAITA